MKPPIRAILWDVDGTLLDTDSLSDKALAVQIPALAQDCSRRIDGRLPWELKKQILGLRGAEWAPIVLTYVQEKYGVPVDTLPTIDQLWSSWEENLNTYCSQVEACPGALELVQSLADGCRASATVLPMAVATSSRRAALVKKQINHGHMFRHFQAIVCGDDPAVQQGKPAPDIYLQAARQLGVDPSQCLVFEDALSGVRSGKAAGCRVVAVPDSRFSPEEKAAFVKEADVVLDSLWSFNGDEFGLDIDMQTIQAQQCTVG
jgi:beta-phosphoglucomutase-like phosphatase (HAD superfamily)